MVSHSNYGLVGLAFLLGLFLTFALTIRRVKREVPVRSSAKAAAAAVKSPSETETTKIKAVADSPHYQQTIAEVWFKDEESAELGGFTPWHKGRNKK